MRKQGRIQLPNFRTGPIPITCTAAPVTVTSIFVKLSQLLVVIELVLCCYLCCCCCCNLNVNLNVNIPITHLYVHASPSPYSYSTTTVTSTSSGASTFFNNNINNIIVNPINVGIRSAIASRSGLSSRPKSILLKGSNDKGNNGGAMNVVERCNVNECTIANTRNRNRGRLTVGRRRSKTAFYGQSRQEGTSSDDIYEYENGGEDVGNNDYSDEPFTTSSNGVMLTSSISNGKGQQIQLNAAPTTTDNDTDTDSDTVRATVATNTNTHTRGGGGRSGQAQTMVHLNFWENMVCGAVSRSIAQTATHPANTMKTLLQSNRVSSTTGGNAAAAAATAAGGRMTLSQIAKLSNLKMLTRGAGAQFVLSIPHGAVNFAVLEYVRRNINHLAMKSEWASEKAENSAAFRPAMDFVSSAIATVCCSVVSTPQMMIVDNIMAGTYPNLASAVGGLSAERGIAGFYTGWWPGLAGKIPSYALTWTLFQQLKQLQLKICQRDPKDFENSIMGCIASATTVCIMIPMDTIKTRLVTQMNYPELVPYKGIIDAAVRISKEEGIGTFYRGLPPRLISVVPMIGIQFGVYEAMKKVMLSRHHDRLMLAQNGKAVVGKNSGEEQTMASVIMEVAADDDQPFPAPALGNYKKSSKGEKKKKKGFGRK